MLTRVGLESKDMFKMPNELSGGMLRRATLAQVRIETGEDKDVITGVI